MLKFGNDIGFGHRTTVNVFETHKHHAAKFHNVQLLQDASKTEEKRYKSEVSIELEKSLPGAAKTPPSPSTAKPPAAHQSPPADGEQPKPAVAKAPSLPPSLAKAVKKSSEKG